MNYYERHRENLKLWPQHVWCFLCGGVCAVVDTGATGVQYRCSLCTVTFRAPAAQVRKRKVAAAIVKVSNRLAKL